MPSFILGCIRNIISQIRSIGRRTFDRIMDNNVMADMSLRVRLSRELRKLRKKKGLTQEQVAEKAGISHRYYQTLESSKPTRSAKIEILEKLHHGLGKKFLNF